MSSEGLVVTNNKSKHMQFPSYACYIHGNFRQTKILDYRNKLICHIRGIFPVMMAVFAV
jgi:hypothetical protein